MAARAQSLPSPCVGQVRCCVDRIACHIGMDLRGCQGHSPIMINNVIIIDAEYKAQQSVLFRKRDNSIRVPSPLQPCWSFFILAEVVSEPRSGGSVTQSQYSRQCAGCC